MSSALIRRPLELWRSLPIRWRLAGGSAGLTFFILCAFAAVVGIMASRQIRGDFSNQVRHSADDLAARLHVTFDPRRLRVTCRSEVNLQDYARGEQAQVRVILQDHTVLCGDASSSVLPSTTEPTQEYEGYLVESRPVPVDLDGVSRGVAYVQYGRPLSDVQHTLARVRLLLVLGALGGAALALLAGLAVARRAMSPIAELTAAAREIERTRDPGRRLGVPDGSDEVAELARTLEAMLVALDAARTETETALTRQRRFVADASHELRTPLTSVLANLELLEAELAGEQRETAESALRSTRRMRRLVADLLLLARADAGREAPRRTVDVAQVVVEAAGELGPVARDHGLEVSADRSAPVEGVPDELHRMVLNLLENAVRHTPAGTAVHVAVHHGEDGSVVVEVADEGPGIPHDLAPRIFDRFVRGGGDAGGGTGLGLAIVRAVAESHGGGVTLDPGGEGRGARFTVTLPAVEAPQPEPAPAA
ncbi:MAG TPA: HAMP domain-containing sensor histidine kinase [Solirubrobacteraceae bacterium]